MDKTSTIVLAGSLIVIMLGMGLSLKISDFTRILIYPKAILTGLVNQIILLPVIGFVLVSILSIQPEIAIGVMILTACPGGPTSNLITHLAKGDTALSVSLTAINSIVTVFTTPFVINYALIHFMSEGQEVQLDVVKTILQIFVVTILPVAIGVSIRYFKERFANKMEQPVRVASGVLVVLVIVGIILKERENVIPFLKKAGWVTFFLNIVTMLIGYYTSRLLKINIRQAISIAIESGIQNGTMAISIASVILCRPDFAIAPAIYSIIMFFSGMGVICVMLYKKQ